MVAAGIGATELLIVIVSLVAVFGSIVAVIAIICWTVIRLASGSRGKTVTKDEAKMIQELFHNLERMEHRVESLETLLLDREEKGGRS